MEVTNMRQMPRAKSYLWGWDMSLSGWGPFAERDKPDELISYAGRGIKIRYSQDNSLCPVIFPIYPDTNIELLMLNMQVCDVQYKEQVGWGKPKTRPKGGYKKWAAKFAEENHVFEHSGVVYGFMASLGFEQFNRNGLHHLMHWWMNIHKLPFVCVRSRDTRWYTEPGLGWTFYDEDEQPFKYAHPCDKAKGSDWVLRDGKISQLGPRSRSHLPKVLPVREAS